MALKYERKLVKEDILELDPKLKKKRPELVEEESDLDDEFIQRHLKAVEEKEAEKLLKQFEKENEKRKEEGQPLLKEMPSPSKKVKKPATMEKLEQRLESITTKIGAQKLAMVDKDESKQTALGTSKINYIDPRISAAWCAKYDVPLEKIFNKSLRDKFKWAMDAGKDFVNSVNFRSFSLHGTNLNIILHSESLHSCFFNLPKATLSL